MNSPHVLLLFTLLCILNPFPWSLCAFFLSQDYYWRRGRSVTVPLTFALFLCLPCNKQCLCSHSSQHAFLAERAFFQSTRCVLGQSQDQTGLLTLRVTLEGLELDTLAFLKDEHQHLAQPRPPGLLSLCIKKRCLVIVACNLSSGAWAPPRAGSIELPQQPLAAPSQGRCARLR